MEFTIEVAHEVEASRERIWAVLQDLPRWPSWDPYLVSMTRVDGAAPNLGEQHWMPGARWVERVRRGIFTPRFRLTVTGLTPGFYVEWQARYLLVTGVHGWSLSETVLRGRTEGCRVTSRETFSGPAPLVVVARVFFSLFRVEVMTKRQLEALGRAAERSA